jgi:hypothetical protein
MALTDLHSFTGIRPLNQDWLQRVVMSSVLDAPDRTTNIGRSIIDGCLVVYPLDQPPAWLLPVLADRDDDGNTSNPYPTD